jgi:hypothetical protein
MELFFFVFFIVPPSLLVAKKWVLGFNIFLDGIPDDPGDGDLFFFGDSFQLRVHVGGKSDRRAGTMSCRRVLIRCDCHVALPVVCPNMHHITPHRCSLKQARLARHVTISCDDAARLRHARFLSIPQQSCATLAPSCFQQARHRQLQRPGKGRCLLRRVTTVDPEVSSGRCARSGLLKLNVRKFPFLETTTSTRCRGKQDCAPKAQARGRGYMTSGIA